MLDRHFLFGYNGTEKGGEGMDLHFLRLWDIYNPLLTDNQREVTDLYFNCDLSLAEIAEQKGCSRQSISDTLAKVRRQLEEYEEKLHIVRLMAESSLAQSFMMTKISKWAQDNLTKEQSAHIQSLIEHDYSEEAKAALAEHADSLT